MRLQSNIVKHKQGDVCPSCASTDAIKQKGTLITQLGKYGAFLGCSRFPECRYTSKATSSDKRKLYGKKTRRGKKKKKSNDPLWQKKVKEAMELHNQQKKERAQMFRDFERLISD